MRKVLSSFVAVCICFSLAAFVAAKQDTKQNPAQSQNQSTQPSDQKVMTVTINQEDPKAIVQHIKAMASGADGWERSAKTLEQKYGVGALAALQLAKEFVKDDQFQQRCQQSIDRIERNAKEGLSGGRSKD
jgi:hypothetical protein